jgi:hypothetical protein
MALADEAFGTLIALLQHTNSPFARKRQGQLNLFAFNLPNSMAM